jgi:FKBP-type peptidyl-prolyl cis-trans isomerase
MKLAALATFTVALCFALVQTGCDSAHEKGSAVSSSSPSDSTGLKIEDIKEGTGPAAVKGDMVDVDYTGWLKNGKQFDSSKGKKPFTFTIGAGQVIKGWDEGVQGMKVGGIRKLYIPPNLGYGQRGAGRVIPPNAELVFEVELLKIIGR